MAHVAIVETFPYEAVWGGDAVYLDGIRTYLTRRGHRVESFVTDMTRGRSNPTMRLPAHAQGQHRWRVRRSMSLIDGHFCSLDPKLIGKALRRLPGRRAPIEHDIDVVEIDWVVDAFKRTPPDLAILAFGACVAAPTIGKLGVMTLALKGFFSDRRIRLGEEMPTPLVGRPLLDALTAATQVGFNNRHDLNLYAELSGHHQGVLVGMGFPERLQPEPNGRPIVLFVGARTQPNVESLRWFLDHVWPMVYGARPDAELRVVGSIGASFVGIQSPNVKVLGFVDQLAAEYRGAFVAIAPLVSGSSGIKTKIAEALSFSRAVVTTSLGVEPGLPQQYGEAVIVADDPASFAQGVLMLLADPTHRVKAAAAQYFTHFAESSAYGEICAMLAPKTLESRVVAE